MESTIVIKVLSPFKTELQENVSYIEVCTTEGVIGIYPNHIPIISSLIDGVLKIKLLDGTLKEFKVSSGFLRILNNECKITVKYLSNI